MKESHIGRTIDFFKESRDALLIGIPWGLVGGPVHDLTLNSPIVQILDLKIGGKLLSIVEKEWKKNIYEPTFIFIHGYLPTKFFSLLPFFDIESSHHNQTNRIFEHWHKNIKGLRLNTIGMYTENKKVFSYFEKQSKHMKIVGDIFYGANVSSEEYRGEEPTTNDISQGALFF